MAQAPRPLDVLVVDPGATDLMFVERFLTLRGHAVINAASGELAVRLAQQTSFDAVRLRRAADRSRRTSRCRDPARNARVRRRAVRALDAGAARRRSASSRDR